MADEQNEQPRTRWPLNEARELRGNPGRLYSGGGEARDTAVLEKSTTGERSAATTAGAADAAADTRPGRYTGEIDFSTYVQDSLRTRGPGAMVTERTRQDERARFERVGYGTLYQSGEQEAPADYDDTVLGLHYTTAAPRAPVGDERWASSLRSFARGAVWCLPVAALLLALSGVFGWPTAQEGPALVSSGTWVVVTSLGLGLWLLGVVALAALVANTAVRPWGYVAVVASTIGIALLTPVVGVTGLARPAISRTADAVANDSQIAGIADQMQSGLLDHSVGRWLVVGGGVLFAVGTLAVAGAILGSRVLQRHDGWLVLLGVGIATLGAVLSWEFMFALAAMVVLAGALGLAYTASRIAPDGTAPPAY